MDDLREIFTSKDGFYTFHTQAHNKDLDIFSVDVIVQSQYTRNNESLAENAAEYFENCLLAKSGDESQVQAVKLLLPAKDGYVSRSNMVAFRMHGVDVDCHGFVEPRQQIQSAVFSDNDLRLDVVLDKAVGLLQIKTVHKSVGDAQAALDRLEANLADRMALPWLLPDPIPFRRVALVGGLEEPKSFAAVKALGIAMVVLDVPGNFLEDPKGQYAYLREEFIPFNMSPDQHAPERIVEALQGKQIDGIYTRYDVHHTNVAKANTMLGLPTSDPRSYAIATNKFDARSLEPDSDSAFRVRDVNDLKTLLPTRSLQYPLIVKPTTGRNSWGVLRCDNEEQLIEAAEVAHGRVVALTADGEEIHSEVMVEPYIDGPEFDVDMVLWDGELLFYEVSDNFPCAGDIPADAPEDFSHQKQTQRDFQETLFVYPSRLVEDEQQILVKSLHKTVLRLGFKCGVFHVEARVRDSRMEYSIQDGRVDLHLKKAVSSQLAPSSFLIETNPRPPGYLSLLRAGWMYGVDYWALHVLRCVNDEARYRAFSVSRKRLPEHVCALNFIIPENGGILRSEDPGLEIAKRRPDLMASIPLYYNEFQPGQFVPPPVSTNFLFMTRMTVESYTGRVHLLNVIRDIRKEWVFDIEEQ